MTNRERMAYQMKANDICMNIYKDAMTQFHAGECISDFERVDYCQAWTIETPDYVILKSYNTIVAIYEKATNTVADVLRTVYGYTATSAKHISKFRNMYRGATVYTSR